MRLVDADAIIDRYNKEIPYALTIEEVMAKVPTAYDIDKVVEELREWSFNATILELHNNELGEYEEECKRDVICTLNAIEIVKQGVR